MRTYIYIISLLLCVVSFAQEKEETVVVEKDTTKSKTYRFGLRIGADLSKLVKSVVIDDYTAFELNADYKFAKKYNVAAEYGFEKRTIDETQVNFTAKGNYFKIGVDYNMYVNWLDMENAIYAGVRYGLSTHTQTLNRYNIYNTDLYWDENNTVNTPIEFDSNTSSWIELILGIKAEVYDNLFLGINVQLKNKVSNTNPDGFENLYIPGFGQTYADSNWGVGFGYTISYFIPFYKK